MDLFYLLRDYETYLVGGAIRDYFLKEDIYDIDIVISANPKFFFEILKKISNKYNIFPLDKERGIYRINLFKNLTVDISRIDDINSDIFKRDFTINSLTVPLKNSNIKITNEKFNLRLNPKNIINLTGGIKDLKHKIIKTITPESFHDDPLRILRAYRFMSWGFKISPKTHKEIVDCKKLISLSAKERIREEILKILKSDNSSSVFKKMAESEVLFEILPILKSQIKCAEIYYGKGGVLKHTFNVLKRLDILYLSPKKYLSASKKVIEEIENRKNEIKMAALLHDIAKPHKAKVIDNRLRFFGHEEYGAILAERILRDYRFSNNEIKYIKTIIANHLRIGNIAHNNIITQKAILRIFYDLKEAALGLLILSWGDHSSYISEKKLEKSYKKTKAKPFAITNKLPRTGFKKTLRFLQVVNSIIKNYEKYNSKSDIKPLINGDTIMKNLNIPSGPNVGKILKKLINLQLEGKIKTQKQAINYIKTLKIP
ncbi:MAG: HD domain-containing protein [Elusimicrobiota bacterium]